MEAFSGQFSTISDQKNRISAGIWGGLLIIPSMVSSRFCQWNPSRFQQHTLIRAHPDILQKIKKVSLGTRNVYIYIYIITSAAAFSAASFSAAVAPAFSLAAFACRWRRLGGGGGGACGKRWWVLGCGFRRFFIGCGWNPLDLLHVALHLV